MRSSAAGEAGFALVVAVFAIVLISAVVTGGYFLSTQQFRAGSVKGQSNAGLYSAEAGLAAALAGWDVTQVGGLAPGSTAAVAAGGLPTGDAYQVWLTRLDGDTSDDVSYYIVRSVGRAHGAGSGRRVVGLLVRTQAPDHRPQPLARRAWLELLK